MLPRIILTIVNGPLEGTEYVFDGPCQQTIGRSGDCTIQLPTNFLHSAVSRHHCMLEINPPSVQVRDMGSLNGTFVNGENIGQQSGDWVRKDESTPLSPPHQLKGGDELQIGDIIFQVGVAGVEDLQSPVYWPPSFE
jgi:pSer/pThr/pTyr-binding forkhead associated (FHA) protein